VSILNQTYGDFTYYCLDNGSTDGTGAIIREYAERDGRIVTLSVPNNIQPGVTAMFLPTFLSRGDDGYIAWLDADDEYKPDFLEKMAAFALENQLDVALSGTEYINNDGTSRLDTPPETLIIEGTGFTEHLPSYHKYTTRMCANLYSLKLLTKMEFPTLDKADKAATFYDVMCPLRAMQHASRTGLLAESLHKYYVNTLQEQLSFRYTPDYFRWINELQRQVRDYILSYGVISSENENFLNVRFLIWIKYILPKIQNADIPLQTRIADLTEIFSDERTKELLSLDWISIGIQTDKREFIGEQLDWAKSQPNSEALIAALEGRLKENFGE